MINTNKGFSLIEMAIVLVIFGLIIGGVMQAMLVQREQAHLKASLSTINDIKEAVIGFSLREGRIPCPDINGDGVEDLTGNNCSNVDGFAPWVTLNVGKYDAWNSHFIYHVSANWADLTDGTGCPDTDIVNMSFEMCSVGDIEVNDGSGVLVAQDVPLVIASLGKNFARSPGAFESENQDGDAVFIDRAYSRNPSNEYDDIVGWLGGDALIRSSSISGRLYVISGAGGAGNSNNGNSNSGNGNNGNGNI